MEEERKAVITVGDNTYELLLTTKATKAIAAKYGGMDKLGEKLLKAENIEMAIDEILWLICLLANQTIMVHNYKHPDEKKELLTEDEVELLTTPYDLGTYREAIAEALYKGTKRNVVSEETSKNTQAG